MTYSNLGSNEEMENSKMKMVLLFMLMMLIVSTHGETKEECYSRCIDDCGRAGVQCIKVCAISRRCNDKPPPAAAVSRPSSAATDDQFQAPDTRL